VCQVSTDSDESDRLVEMRVVHAESSIAREQTRAVAEIQAAFMQAFMASLITDLRNLE